MLKLKIEDCKKFNHINNYNSVLQEQFNLKKMFIYYCYLHIYCFKLKILLNHIYQFIFIYLIN